MILWGFLIGMVFCAAALSLLYVNDHRVADKFGSAGTMFTAWCAFGMLLMAGTYGLGLLIPGLVAATVLVARKSRLGQWLSPLSPYKLPLGVAALICSIVAWLGVLNLMKELPNG